MADQGKDVGDREEKTIVLYEEEEKNGSDKVKTPSGIVSDSDDSYPPSDSDDLGPLSSDETVHLSDSDSSDPLSDSDFPPDFYSRRNSLPPATLRKYNRKFLKSKAFEKYCEEVAESEGFDIFTYPGPSVWTMYVPLTNMKNERLIELAKMAVTQYNTDHKMAYEFVDLEKVNARVAAGSIYYITFRVKNVKVGNVNGHDTPLETFQARVWDGVEKKHVQLCRPKPIKPQI